MTSARTASTGAAPAATLGLAAASGVVALRVLARGGQAPAVMSAVRPLDSQRRWPSAEASRATPAAASRGRGNRPFEPRRVRECQTAWPDWRGNHRHCRGPERDSAGSLPQVTTSAGNPVKRRRALVASSAPSSTAVTASPRSASGAVACPVPQPISITRPPLRIRLVGSGRRTVAADRGAWCAGSPPLPGRIRPASHGASGHPARISG